MTNRRGFTLIELLVVIAIIALLASILFPVFSRAREKSRQASCASNMKQLGLAMMQYTQDYDEYPAVGLADGYPGYGYTSACGTYGGLGWASQLYTYAKSAGVYSCPDDPTVPASGNSVVSYALNCPNMIQSCTALPPDFSIPNAYPVSQYVSPALTIMLSEFRMPNKTGVALPNETMVSQAYLSPATSPGTTNANGYGAKCRIGNYCYGASDCGGLVTGYLQGQTALNQVYYSQPYVNHCPATGDTNYTGLHSSQANYLFMDGHVKSVNGGLVSPGGNNISSGRPNSAGAPASNATVAAGTAYPGIAATYSIY